MDDIFSGQPIGSAVFLWSTIFVVLDTLDRKAIQRDYWQDWFIASIAIAFVVIGGMLIADFPRNLLFLNILIPQILLSILLYPFITRLIGAIDNWRVST